VPGSASDESAFVLEGMRSGAGRSTSPSSAYLAESFLHRGSHKERCNGEQGGVLILPPDRLTSWSRDGRSSDSWFVQAPLENGRSSDFDLVGFFDTELTQAYHFAYLIRLCCSWDSLPTSGGTSLHDSSGVTSHFLNPLGHEACAFETGGSLKSSGLYQSGWYFRFLALL
jgi:hypothetical protein